MKTIKKISILGIFFLALSCGGKKTDKLNKIYKYNNAYLNESEIAKTIDYFIKSKNISKGNLYVDTLLMFNKKGGFLYYEKGFVEGYNFQTKEALKDFQIAESLGYNREKCETMIKTTQILIDAVNNK